MSMLFAATYPDRVHALALYGTYPHFSSFVLAPDRVQSFIDAIETRWGTGDSVRFFAPSRANDDRFRAWWAKFERLGASPSAVIALTRMNCEIDVRHVVRSIRVPTLVLHRAGDSRVNVGAGRFLGQNIPTVKYVELAGSDHVAWVGDSDSILSELEEFFTGSRAHVDVDRVLATVLFTDIVDSTRRAVELGDRGWSRVLEQHDQIVRREITRYRGREIRALGDGFLATFDGPARAVRCASDIAERIHIELGFNIRSGVHTGEVELKGEDIGGIAVHMASRIADLAGPGEVYVSSTVRDLVAGSGLRFRDLGRHAAKGLPEELRLFVLEPAAALAGPRIEPAH